jgi:hypothetical protein
MDKDDYSNDSVSTSDSHERKLQKYKKFIEEDKSRKRKKYCQGIVAIENNEDEGKEYKKPTMEITVDKNSGKDEALSTYLSSCRNLGLIDKISDKDVHYKNITRSHGWKVFKLVGESDFVLGSKFANYMCKICLQDPSDPETIVWWKDTKSIFQKTMQDMRSTCTQAMKKVF